MSKKIIVTFIGAFALFVGVTSAKAATYEQMKDQVVNHSGEIQTSDSSKGALTHEEALEYLAMVDEEMAKEKVEFPTTEMLSTAEMKFLSAEGVKNLKKELADIRLSQEMLRGASIPTKEYKLTGKTYTSNAFSASGWRFSEIYFTFKNYAANPYFGVRVNHDSFNFITRSGTVKKDTNAIYPNENFRYISNYGSYNGYFSTYNPIGGSYYEIN